MPIGRLHVSLGLSLGALEPNGKRPLADGDALNTVGHCRGKKLQPERTDTLLGRQFGQFLKAVAQTFW